MGNGALGTVVAPPGSVLQVPAGSTLCKAYLLGLDAWCNDKAKGVKTGDFNKYVFDKLKAPELQPEGQGLFDALTPTRELPVGAIFSGGWVGGFENIAASGGPLAKLAQGALAVVKASVAAGGLGSGPANLYRCVGATEMRSAFGGTTLEHVLFPDATLPNGNALEIKRPSEKESHENQFENYAQASPGGACEVLSCKGCAGDACPKKGDDCPAPKV